jgi:hypothetical protein
MVSRKTANAFPFPKICPSKEVIKADDCAQTIPCCSTMNYLIVGLIVEKISLFWAEVWWNELQSNNLWDHSKRFMAQLKN